MEYLHGRPLGDYTALCLRDAGKLCQSSPAIFYTNFCRWWFVMLRLSVAFPVLLRPVRI
jgi:hypothetical protein